MSNPIDDTARQHDFGEHKNRIVAMGYIDPRELVAHPGNPRIHPVDQQKQMASLLKTLGWLMPIVVNKRTGHVLDGHMRIPEAINAGAEVVPVAIVDIEEDEEAIALATINPIADQAVFDKRLAAQLLEKAAKLTDDPAIQELMRKTKQRHQIGITGGENQQFFDDSQGNSPQIEVSGEKILTLRKQTSHVFCIGDSTDPSLIQDALSRGTKPPTLIVTDPPYGIDYIDTKSRVNVSGLATIKERWDDIDNDTIDSSELLYTALSNITNFRGSFLAAYVWSPELDMQCKFIDAMNRANFLVHRKIIWKKPGFVLTRTGHWHWAHETCLYGWYKGVVPDWHFEKNLTTVWEEPYPKNTAHPTAKPSGLWKRPIEVHTLPGDTIVDPFAGSAPAIIAADETLRTAVCIEINEKLAALAIQKLKEQGFTIG